MALMGRLYLGLMGTLLGVAIVAAGDLADASAAQAGGEPMSPEEFRAYAEGHTLYFEKDGEPWGSESFDESGDVIWRYPSGDCMPGVWRPHEGNVCFYYGLGSEVLCWSLTKRDDGILGRLLDGPDKGLELLITERDRRPLLCSQGGEQL